MQNVRRRAEQDVAKAHKFGLEKFVGDMVVVADNLERSVAAMTDENVDVTVLKEGIDLTLKSLVDGLKRHHVEAVDPEGTPFDPQLHQAMSAVEQADVEPNTVLNVYQKGYTLHGRLVRPAMVVVSKATAS
jgi:molecular chaperone GrpE